LFEIEKLTGQETAEVLGVPLGTVKSRILRGRRALKDLLEPLLTELTQLSGDRDRLSAEIRELHGWFVREIVFL